MKFLSEKVATYYFFALICKLVESTTLLFISALVLRSLYKCLIFKTNLL